MSITVLNSSGSPVTINTIDDLIALTTGLKVGGKYTSTPSSLSDGDLSELKLDANGYLFVTIGAGAFDPGRADAADSSPVVLSTEDLAAISNDPYSEYEAVAASATDQVLGATGATGDYLSHVTVFPGTAGCGVVTIKDGSTTIGTFAGGGTTALPSLVPFTIEIRMKSVNGAWKVTTGANVTCIGVGNFT